MYTLVIVFFVLSGSNNNLSSAGSSSTTVNVPGFTTLRACEDELYRAKETASGVRVIYSRCMKLN